MEDIAKILGNYGFPIAVTMFLLIRMEKTIAELREAVEDLKQKNELLAAKVAELHEKIIAMLEKRRK